MINLSLREIFDNHLTLSSDKWEPYFDVYELSFNKFRNTKPVVVEVGVQGGGSLQMWEKYFGEGSRIVGIDIDQNVLLNVPHYSDNIEVVIGDQSSTQFWESFCNKVPNIDVFIDDGSHASQHQITTFEAVFPKMKPGSVYLCEDTHANWTEKPGQLFHQDSFIQYTKNLIDAMHLRHMNQIERNLGWPVSPIVETHMIKLCENMQSIQIFESMVVFTKYNEQEFKRVSPKNR